MVHSITRIAIIIFTHTTPDGGEFHIEPEAKACAEVGEARLICSDKYFLMVFSGNRFTNGKLEGGTG